MGICCMTQGTQTRAQKQPRRVGWAESWEDVHVGGDMGKSVADSCWDIFQLR